MLIIADGHVHLHDSFPTGAVFDAATESFESAAGGQGFSGILFLTDMAGTFAFERLGALADAGEPCGGPSKQWRPLRLPDPVSLRIRRQDSAEITVIAGSQIVSAERLEVLALGMTDRLPDGRPLPDTVSDIRRAGGVAVLPWGFGKWTGRRRSTILAYLSGLPSEDVYLGDIRARPALLPEPTAFSVGRARGLRILPGTDPLPFPREATCIGSFGFLCTGTFDPEQPWPSLKAVMTDRNFSPTPYGPKQPSLEFLSNQVRLRLRKYVAAAA